MSGWKLVTLRLRVGGEGGYTLPEGAVDWDDSGHWLLEPGDHIIKVEDVPRPLPTELGSLILARVDRDDGAVVRFPAMALTLSSQGDWWGNAERVRTEAIQSDWVQIDPATLRPVEEES